MTTKASGDYSESCPCDHLYSETTSIQGPLGHVLIVALPCILRLLRDHLYSKTTFFFWPKRGRLIQASLYCVFKLIGVSYCVHNVTTAVVPTTRSI